MTPRGVVSDVLLVAGAGAIGYFVWQAWEPAVWLWAGLTAMAYGWRLGVVDASASDSAD